MPNQVLTIFTADAKDFFATADAVEARANNLFKTPASPAAATQNPFIQQSEANTKAAEKQAAKQVEAEKATTRAVIAETEKRVAAKKAEAAQIAAIPISNYRNLPENQSVTQTTTPFTSGKTAAQLLFESGSPGSRVNAGALSLERLAQLNRNAIQDETKVRLEGLKAQETGFASYFRNISEQRAKGLVETEVLQRAETKLVLAETEKRAVAQRSSLLARDTLAIPIGGGLTSRIGLTGPIGIGIGATLAISAGTIASVLEYTKNITDAEGRTARFSVTSERSGIAVKELQANLDAVSRSFRTTKADAEKIIDPLATIAENTHKSLTTLTQSATDIAAQRGIDKDKLPSVLNNIAQGQPDPTIFGRNAASVFDLYASSLGTTADKLTEVQREQALVNRLLQEGALAAGSAANATSNQAAQTDALKKSFDSLVVAFGAAATPVVKPALDQITTLLGGQPEFGRFDPSRASQSYLASNRPGFGALKYVPTADYFYGTLFTLFGQQKKSEDIYAPDINASGRDDKTRMDAIIKQFNDDRKAVQDAIANPTKDIVNQGLSKINLTSFLTLSPEQRQQAKQDAIQNAKDLVATQAQAFQTGFQINGGNIQELQRLYRNVFAQNFVDPSVTKQLTDQGEKAIDATFRSMIESAKTNIPKLRQLYKQIVSAPELLPLDQTALLRTINDQIDQVIKSQQEKVKQLADSFRSAFDSVVSKDASRNPYLQLLTETDKATRTLTQSTRGLSPAIKDALLQRVNFDAQLQRESLRFNTLQTAGNLQNEAGQFQRFNNTGSTDSFEVRSLKNFIADQGPLSDERKKFFDDWLADVQKQDFQKTVDQTIGFAQRSFLSSNKPTPDERHLFDQAVIQATPLNRINDLSRGEIDSAIGARQEDAAFQAAQEQQAQTDRTQLNTLLEAANANLAALLAVVNKGGGLPVNFGTQPIIEIDVKSKELTVERSSQPGKPKSTKESMGQ